MDATTLKRGAKCVGLSILVGPPTAAMTALFSMAAVSDGNGAMRSALGGVVPYLIGGYLIGLPAAALSGLLIGVALSLVQSKRWHLPQSLAQSRVLSGLLLGAVCGLLSTFVFGLPVALILWSGAVAGAICGVLCFSLLSNAA
jgi:hypothetical protein